MGIVDEDVAAVRQGVDFVALVSQYAQLKRVGRRWMGLCPFHAEKSPSFSVNAEDGLWYCHGCQASGDAITFVRQIEHLDFVASVEWLAARSGVTLHYTDVGESESRQARKRLHEAMGQAVEWYHDRLLTGPDAGAARAYLRSRGFDGETVRRYQLGWAPDAWTTLVTALRLPEQVAVDTGLGFRNRNGQTTDAFRGRLLFPIYDAEGRPVAFGGRVLPGTDGPKYKNSPETALYTKSRVLYGLNWHKGEIVRGADNGEAIVCEGYTDVIGFARAGAPRAVATCGTALTEEHVKLLSRFAKRIVLAFDADAAGQGAADRFHAWEQRYQLEVLVADLPRGEDPGSLAVREPGRLLESVQRLAEWRGGEVGAKPYLAFRLDRSLSSSDLATPEGRARAAAAGVAIVGEHPNELVRDQYLMKLADRTRTDVDRLRGQLRTGTGRAAGRWSDRPDPRDLTGPGGPGPEVEALALLIQRRDEMVGWLDDALFVDERHLSVWWALQAEAELPAALALLRGNDPAAADVLARVAVLDPDSEPDDVGARLIQLAGERRVRELAAAIRAGDDPIAVNDEIRSLKLGMEGLGERATRSVAAGQLLPFLRARSGDGG
ncbi:MAG: DNA primase [Acidimicrobiales bacterium]